MSRHLLSGGSLSQPRTLIEGIVCFLQGYGSRDCQHALFIGSRSRTLISARLIYIFPASVAYTEGDRPRIPGDGLDLVGKNLLWRIVFPRAEIVVQRSIF